MKSISWGPGGIGRVVSHGVMAALVAWTGRGRLRGGAHPHLGLRAGARSRIEQGDLFATSQMSPRPCVRFQAEGAHRCSSIVTEKIHAAHRFKFQVPRAYLLLATSSINN